MARSNLLLYLLRRDLRVADNPILHHLATSKDHGFTHVLPIYIFPSHQLEVSGFLSEGSKSPYPEARSQVGNFWRCGPHRARFLAQSVWDVKQSLEALDSGLLIRVGSFHDVVDHVIKSLSGNGIGVSAVWMTEEKSYEELQEQDSVSAVCSSHSVDFRLWDDEKYLIDDRDTGLERPRDLPDVFTTYRKSQEPLRERPRTPLPKPQKSALPPFLDAHASPPQFPPFVAAESLGDLESKLTSPLGTLFPGEPPFPENAKSAHPFGGGETEAWRRLEHLIMSGAMTAYKSTRNGLIGSDFSTKLSGYLALGSVSARQVHDELVKFEDGTSSKYAAANGYGQGENEGTRAVRFELLWRDYMRLCTCKFGRKLFRLSGFRDGEYSRTWNSASARQASAHQNPPPEKVAHILERFLQGTTGMGLIDASQRELFHTGYTSNRARQNVASFLAKHLQIDWRYGAEWYESMLVDYDVSSNWSNWLYVAGVGNDPRGDARIFNPVKQAFDYDRDGSYVRMWVPEVRDMTKIENVFQPCTASREDLDRTGMANHIMVTDPIKRIEFSVDKKPRASRKPAAKWKGRRNQGKKQSAGGNWDAPDTHLVIKRQYNTGHHQVNGANGSSRAIGEDGTAMSNRASVSDEGSGTCGMHGADWNLAANNGVGMANGVNGMHGAHHHPNEWQRSGSYQASQPVPMNQYQQPQGFYSQYNNMSLPPPGYAVPIYYTSPAGLGQSSAGNYPWYSGPGNYPPHGGRGGAGQPSRGRGTRRGGPRPSGHNNYPFGPVVNNHGNQFYGPRY